MQEPRARYTERRWLDSHQLLRLEVRRRAANTLASSLRFPPNRLRPTRFRLCSPQKKTPTGIFLGYRSGFFINPFFQEISFALFSSGIQFLELPERYYDGCWQSAGQRLTGRARPDADWSSGFPRVVCRICDSFTFCPQKSIAGGAMQFARLNHPLM
jgi:hypothetical protein